MKKIKVAINGFGRIGRQVAKIIMEDAADILDLVAIYDLYDSKMNAHLFKYFCLFTTLAMASVTAKSLWM